MQFWVRHVPAGTGAVVEEALPADSEAGLRSQLLAQGSVVLALRAQRTQGLRRNRRFDVAGWCRELEALLRAGMTAVEAVETLAATSATSIGSERERVHGQLLKSLREGASLSKAMRGTQAFPEVLVAGVTASERTSTLAEALHDYLRYDDLLQKLRRQAVSAMLYPAIVIGLGGCIAMFLLLYVIPRFSKMYGSFHGELSTATAAVLALSRAMRDYGWLVGLAVAGIAAAGVLAWRSGQLARGLEAGAEAWPMLRRQWDHFRFAKLYQSLALLFRGGYSLDEALLVCGGLALGVRVGQGVSTVRQEIANGRPASKALATAGFTDVTAERLLAVGERTGDFAGVLQTIADRHAQAFVLFIERATRLLEPILLLAVALVVGGLVVMMYLPIFDIAGGLGVSR
ncbi:type II secretion system F family protein [Pelomonas aquatica]|jgi:general secretion pathway protein F|uniref:General secretion pathway protein F n=1 Tax=Pelomonas aquatica TaxID=431058 RepID=A0A9X4LKF5_9BURK|nr:type II secretion system F family protein [Pelomonas aquatica]MCY4757293.1 type II secretion system F family protein [Pelomonas aquatica]MDG0864137.1 type II secretion system F family protein [Pelomonas aquatica]